MPRRVAAAIHTIPKIVFFHKFCVLKCGVIKDKLYEKIAIPHPKPKILFTILNSKLSKKIDVLRIQRKPIKEVLSQNQDSISSIENLLNGQYVNQNSEFLNNTVVNCFDKMTNTFTNVFHPILKVN